LASRHGIRPTKQRGQNFVVDPNTIRRIVRLADVGAGDVVLEVGPGLGSLTLGLLGSGARVVAVELDAGLADALPGTVAEVAPHFSDCLAVVHADAMTVPASDLAVPGPARHLVANLPYNVAVPVLLRLLGDLPQLDAVLVMVQREVAERLVAGPGSRTYGSPSVKLAWYGSAAMAGSVPRSVFWPVPNVDSALVRLTRADPPDASVSRDEVFAVVNAAFGQRRKMLRSALARWAGGVAQATAILHAAGVAPTERGEQLSIDDFVAIAQAAESSA